MMTNNDVKIKAISISRIDYKDNDKLITLFSKARGKVIALAKGFNKPNSKLSYSSFLCLGDYILATRGNTFVLTSVESEEMYINIREDYVKLCVASILFETLKVDFYEENTAVFDLVIESLQKINNATNNEYQVLNCYLIKFLTLIGFKPQIFSCAVSGKELNLNDKIVFDYSEGGLCLKKLSEGDYLPMTKEELTSISLANQGSEKSQNAENEKAVVLKLCDFFSYVTGLPIKSKSLLSV